MAEQLSPELSKMSIMLGVDCIDDLLFEDLVGGDPIQ